MDRGSMEAIYFGQRHAPQGAGSGDGPWIGADLERGEYYSNSTEASIPSLVAVEIIHSLFLTIFVSCFWHVWLVYGIYRFINCINRLIHSRTNGLAG